MQHPIDFYRSLKDIHGQRTFNILREYLQVMALKILYEIKGSEFLRFGGGTCLRICHNLPRYSEDLDFSLDKTGIDIKKIISLLEKGFRQENVSFGLSIPKSVDAKRVAKFWLQFPDILHELGESPHVSEKLSIKLEIDKYPPKKGKGESFYVNAFKQYFPIYKSDLPTLFSGKIGAVCQRGYDAMRDFYDLLWYLNKGIEPNYQELHEIGIKVNDRKSLIMLLEKRALMVDGKKIIERLKGLLENPYAEEKMLDNYPAAFNQAAERFLEKS